MEYLGYKPLYLREVDHLRAEVNPLQDSLNIADNKRGMLLQCTGLLRLPCGPDLMMMMQASQGAEIQGHEEVDEKRERCNRKERQREGRQRPSILDERSADRTVLERATLSPKRDAIKPDRAHTPPDASFSLTSINMFFP